MVKNFLAIRCVEQGTTLAPGHFNIYTNNINNKIIETGCYVTVNKKIKLAMLNFIDDCNIFSNFIDKIQDGLNEYKKKIEEKYLELNKIKCKYSVLNSKKEYNIYILMIIN